MDKVLLIVEVQRVVRPQVLIIKGPFKEGQHLGGEWMLSMGSLHEND
jgi:hypothetical protein